MPNRLAVRTETDRPRRGTIVWGDGFFEHRQAEPLDIHVHRGVEIGIVAKGEERIHFGTHILRCSRGDVWLCAPYEPHGWEVPEGGVRNLVIIFLPELLGEEMLGTVPWLTLFAVAPELRARAPAPRTRGRLLSLVQDLSEELASKRPAWETAVRFGILQFLLELSRHWPLLASDRQGDLPRADFAGLSRILPAFTLIHSEPSRRVGVTDAAAACSLSPSRFQFVFRQVTGTHFGQFCRRNRLAFAAFLLLNSEKPIEAVADEAGFYDHSHFHRSFVSTYGRPPGQFRKQRGTRRRQTYVRR